MRTTVDLDPDVLHAVKELARRQGQSLGRVLSDLARRALIAPAAHGTQEPRPSFYGFEPFPSRGAVVDNETIDRLRDEEGL